MRHEPRESGPGQETAVLGLPLAGAPLDVAKLAAAILMLGDHVNTVLLDSEQREFWHLGRIAFPLFCYVTACHLLRGADARRYLIVLLVLAVATQPIFALTFNNQLGSILFTLAGGAALALWMRRIPVWAQHLIFLIGVAIAFTLPLEARSGVDFGVPGMLLPAAMLLALSRPAHLVWLAVLLFTINAYALRPPGEPGWQGALVDGACAMLGSMAVIGVASLFRGRPRFLPRYALQLFYPGHLAALAAIRALS